jgi:hypothetical protein
MQVGAFSTPGTPDWRWRIVNYAGETIEESPKSFPTIALAMKDGRTRLQKMDVDRSVPRAAPVGRARAPAALDDDGGPRPAPPHVPTRAPRPRSTEAPLRLATVGPGHRPAPILGPSPEMGDLVGHVERAACGPVTAVPIIGRPHDHRIGATGEASTLDRPRARAVPSRAATTERLCAVVGR